MEILPFMISVHAISASVFWLFQTLLEVKFLTQVIMLQIYPVSNHFFWQSKRHVFKTMCNAQSEDWMNPEKKKK